MVDLFKLIVIKCIIKLKKVIVNIGIRTPDLPRGGKILENLDALPTALSRQTNAEGNCNRNISNTVQSCDTCVLALSVR